MLRKVRAVLLPSGREIPALGQGTWRMGEDPAKRQREIDSLRLGLDLGMTLIDTAEMYGDGAAEERVAEAIRGRRKEVFLVSKVLPHHATMRGTLKACVRSLQRLKTDYLDLYLLHWRVSPSEPPLEETLEAFQSLKRAGKIRDYGVSNFDVDDMEEVMQLPGSEEIVTNQVQYNLNHRGIEWDLLPWCRERNIRVMAYSPVDHGEMEIRPELAIVARRHGATPAQVALAWVLRHPDVIAIPKASRPEHVRENAEALNLKLTEQDLTELDLAFSPPHQKIALAMR